MPQMLTHDQAIAQKENPGRRRYHGTSRSEDEKTLTIAEDLPAETPLLPCTSLPVKNTALRFPRPSKRRRRVTLDGRPVMSRKSPGEINGIMLRRAPLRQSPRKSGDAYNRTEMSDPFDQAGGSLHGDPVREGVPVLPTIGRPSPYSSMTLADEDGPSAMFFSCEHVDQEAPNNIISSSEIPATATTPKPVQDVDNYNNSEFKVTEDHDVEAGPHSAVAESSSMFR